MEERSKNRHEGAGIVKKPLRILYAVCVLLLLADVFIHKHTHISAEQWFGFHALYGFAAAVVLVLAARGLRVVLGRKEDYYD